MKNSSSSDIIINHSWSCFCSGYVRLSKRRVFFPPSLPGCRRLSSSNSSASASAYKYAFLVLNKHTQQMHACKYTWIQQTDVFRHLWVKGICWIVGQRDMFSWASWWAVIWASWWAVIRWRIICLCCCCLCCCLSCCLCLFFMDSVMCCIHASFYHNVVC